ncbi:phosphohydrolase [Streptomyces sp. NPDC057445]|uniref:phosphohydrolase n=1 Tax=Streptomyces sp. NPDC057445 TaxID=3346136 RepID=UPI0036BA0E71
MADLLAGLGAPPRLAAHLRAVHDVAHQLVAWAADSCPGLVVDREAVLVGAATHDMGKTLHIAELSGPGSAHEEAGRQLLLDGGFGADLARFAGTHASWTSPTATIEDLLVSTADKVGKNERVPELEDLVIARLAEAGGRERWEEYMALDEVPALVGEGAAGRPSRRRFRCAPE